MAPELRGGQPVLQLTTTEGTNMSPEIEIKRKKQLWGPTYSETNPTKASSFLCPKDQAQVLSQQNLLLKEPSGNPGWIQKSLADL